VTTASKHRNREAMQNLTCIFCTEIKFSLQPKARTVTSRSQLSLDEAMIPWQSRLKFRIYNPGKITKYGVLVRMICEAVCGYICNMEIYSGEGKKLEDTVLSLLDSNLGRNYHIKKISITV
jgi:hypothetical protein